MSCLTAWVVQKVTTVLYKAIHKCFWLAWNMLNCLPHSFSKTWWEKEKMMVTSIFSFSLQCFLPNQRQQSGFKHHWFCRLQLLLTVKSMQNGGGTVNWLIHWIVFYTSFNINPVISPWHLALSMSFLGFASAYADAFCPRTLLRKKTSGSSEALTLDLQVTSPTLYHWPIHDSISDC